MKKEPTIFSYDMLREKMGPVEIINRMDIPDRVKINVKRLLMENVPVVYCDTIHAAKGLEFDHVMLTLDLPQLCFIDGIREPTPYASSHGRRYAA